ncbi:MAG: hypothetical protein AAFZ17_17155 [Cyanobacteria bacterium J06650_10]
MIGGIFETIGKTLGVGKEKYFLELDDAAEDSVKNIKQVANKATKTAKAASADVVEKAQDIVENVTDKAEAVADTATDNANVAAKKIEKAAKAPVANKKSAKTTKGKQPVATKQGDESAEKAVLTPAVPAGPSAEDLIVAAIAATSKENARDAQGNVIAQETTTFATDYLMTPSRSSRRRPGPSLSPFKDMAKEANPRLKG